VHRGEIVGEAVWPAIIPPEQSRRIRAKLDDPTRRVNRTARRYLLAGMLRCEACGATLMSHPRKGRRRYVCKTGTDFDGCGAITVTAERVEELITGAVLLRLDTPELAAAMNGRHAQDVEAATAAEEVAAEQEQLAELAQLYADRAITAAEWMTARSRIEARLERAEKRLARLQQNGDLQGLAGNGEQLRADWTTLDLSRQQAIIGALLDHAVIHRATVPGGQFDPGRVTPVWKL
jgi:site-specific DNA recombinase